MSRLWSTEPFRAPFPGICDRCDKLFTRGDLVRRGPYNTWQHEHCPGLEGTGHE